MKWLAVPAFSLLVFAAPLPKLAAQICSPDPKPQVDNGYTYVREEMKALQWIRYGLIELKKIPPSTFQDPPQFHKLVQLHTTAETVKDDYNCAIHMLQPYEASVDEHIRKSAHALLRVIETTKEINEKLVGTMDSLYNAQKAEDIDQVGLAKMLGNVVSMQKDLANMAMLGTKISLFSIVKLEGAGDSQKPVGFNISLQERAVLRADAQELVNNKGVSTYVDACVDIILSALNLNFDVVDSQKKKAAK